MKNRIIAAGFIIILQLFAGSVSAQKSITIDAGAAQPFQMVSKSNNTVNLLFNFNRVDFSLFNANNENFTQIDIDGFGKTYQAGTPDLPVFVKLIAVPKNVTLELEKVTYQSAIYNLADYGMQDYIKPAIPSISKSDDPQKVKYTLGATYFRDEFKDDNALALNFVGVMRDVAIYELIYKPLSYNAVKNLIKTRQNLTANLVSINADFNADSWNFEEIVLQVNTINKKAGSVTEETMVIVSPAAYKSSLQPFVKWKKQLGFHVIESYIGEQIGSNDKTTIKNYLKNLYENPDQDIQKPKYILIIGDVAEIPTWNGVTDSHVTDLNYAEYTDDFLPEVYYGRFSVSNNDELVTMIDKTLYVEKTVNGNFDYQNNHLLISGVDNTYAPNWGNGAIRYFLKYYSHADFSITPKYYLYGSGSPITSNNSGARQAILNDFSAGAGIAYYTAHGSVNGWTDPSFRTADIPSLSNKDKYPLMIGNCCESLKFNLTSFGEAIVRVKDKGAVAYIGASDFSYWDEDYYWGVGFTNNIVNDPVYENTGLGNFDAWFHSHNEAVSKHIYTVGEILNVGNLAVQESSSTLKNYYWEVYHILGDPSLVPAKFKNTRITAQYEQLIAIGQNSFAVETAPNAKISLTENNNIIAFGIADELGHCTLTFEPLSQIGEKLVELVVSKPDNAPIIDSLTVIAPNGPYLVFKGAIINDSLSNNNGIADFGENVGIHVSLQNFGNEPAMNTKVLISCNSMWIEEPVSNIELPFGNITKSQLITSATGVILTLKNNVPYNEIIPFSGKMIYNDTVETHFEFTIVAGAPFVDATEWKIDEQGIGNLNGTIDASENSSIFVTFSNLGSAQISNTLVVFKSPNDQLIQVLTDSIAMGGLNMEQQKTIELQVKAGVDIFPGDILELEFTVLAGETHQYEFKSVIPLVMGSQPQFLMSNSSVDIITGYFYDTGGPNLSYSNNENYTMTFTPYRPNQGLDVEFLNFDVEPSSAGCYDKFYVYDGNSTTAPLLGTFCNTNMINSIQSQNETGALTFKFTSDNAVTKPGWKAYISSANKYQVKFKVTDGIDLIDSAAVQFVNSNEISLNGGVAIFDNILAIGNKKLSVIKEGYLPFEKAIGKISSDTTITVLIHKLPDICFTISEGINLLEGVKIEFDSRVLYTDNKGFANFVNVTSGSKTFKASFEGYIDTTGMLEVTDIDFCYSIKMVKIPTYTLIFNIGDEFGPLPDAEIAINETLLLTNVNGEAIATGLIDGNYNYTISKPGYVTLDSQITVATNSNVTHVIKHITFNVTFTVKNNQMLIANSKIEMDGYSLNTNDLGVAVFNAVIPNNEIPYTVSHTDYNTYQGAVALLDEDVEVLVDLILVGVDETKSEIVIYPNPVNGNATLNISSLAKIDDLKLFGYTGTLLVHKTKLPGNYLLETSGLNSGIYLLQLEVEGEVYREKVIVK